MHVWTQPVWICKTVYLPLVHFLLPLHPWIMCKKIKLNKKQTNNKENRKEKYTINTSVSQIHATSALFSHSVGPQCYGLYAFSLLSFISFNTSSNLQLYLFGVDSSLIYYRWVWGAKWIKVSNHTGKCQLDALPTCPQDTAWTPFPRERLLVRGGCFVLT